MAAPQSTTRSKPKQGGERTVHTMKPVTKPKPTPDPEPPEPPEEPGDAGGGWLTPDARTIIALVVALVLGVATVLLGNNLVPQELSTLNLVVFGLVSVVVAAIGTLPMRWGWYVVPGVTVAFYGLGMYNLINTGDTVFNIVSGEALGYAVAGPATGVAVGYALQFVYKFVAGE